jgi:hypothetical protein
MIRPGDLVKFVEGCPVYADGARDGVVFLTGVSAAPPLRATLDRLRPQLAEEQVQALTEAVEEVERTGEAWLLVRTEATARWPFGQDYLVNPAWVEVIIHDAAAWN